MIATQPPPPLLEGSQSLAAGQSQVWETFCHPPNEYSPVPFYWWAGEALDRGRIIWQLDQLRDKGVCRVVISYPHRPDGTSDCGDPPLFSAAWWDLLRWFLAACRERGMTAGFQDYTLTAPILQAIGDETPDMQGGQLSSVAGQAAAGQPLRLAAEQGSVIVGAWVCPLAEGTPRWDERVDVLENVADGELNWVAGPTGDWWGVLVFARPSAFDPLHPESGRLAIERLYEPFERECPDELGVTLNLFFQDELDFGGRMPFWSNRLFAAFAEAKGYDLAPMLPALWHDLGPCSEKIRLDYAEVVSRCIAKRYFEPVFGWHEARGILWGHDNCGRGRVAEGRAHYGDYFQTMRWFSAPGCDDPKLHGPRAFKGLKVNSSIAHIYQRPRVWLEAFHSSGWGTTPAEIVSALHEDFVCGANLVNPHGLYYSTRGGWWEWAPPDTHFRQPYWQHAASLQSYLTRMCWLLSQGTHRCDVALLYPTEALDAQPADPSLQGLKAHTGNEAIVTAGPVPANAEESAFALGKFLFDHACDFDFVDATSLADSRAAAGELCVIGARYRVLILPAMAAVRHTTLTRALALVQAGGLVIAFGCLPQATDLAGRDAPEVHGLLEKLFGAAVADDDLYQTHAGGGLACYCRDDLGKVLQIINETIKRDVESSAPLQVLHRQLENEDVYLFVNPANEPVHSEVSVRRSGPASQWDAWTARQLPLGAAPRLALDFGPREAKVVVVGSSAEGRAREAVAPVARARAAGRVVALDGPWQSTLRPTLDNRFGDFRLPATTGLLGPEARVFRWADEVGPAAAWHCPTFDDSGWPETTYSFGTRMEVLGPLAPECVPDPAEVLEDANGHVWQPYALSLRWGIERDPHLTNWLSGPHGLKGRVPDEIMDFYHPVAGTVWYVRAEVMAAAAGEVPLVTGARCIYQVWVNGEQVAEQPVALPPGLYEPWNIPHYECQPRETRVMLRPGSNQVLVRLVQPAGQRTRGYFAFQPPAAQPERLALRWFTEPGVPRPCVMAPAARRAVWLRLSGPPGIRGLRFMARGPASVWVAGRAAAMELLEELADGCQRWRATLAEPVVEAAVVAIRVEAPADSHAGDVLPEPVEFDCGAGVIATGDWCHHGLASYSGIVEYSRTIELTAADLTNRVTLDLGEVATTCEVRINGQLAATLVTAPRRVELNRWLRAGSNELAIAVANTLANHYSIGIPTPYAFATQTRSGLLGPVRLELTPRQPAETF